MWIGESSRGLSGILDARITLEADVSAAAARWRATIPAHLPWSWGRGSTATVIPGWYHACMAMTLRLPDDLDAKLAERARREGRSKQELAIEAIRDAQNRAELQVEDVLAELMDSDAEILDYLK